MSLTSKSICTSVRGSKEPTHYSGIAPDKCEIHAAPKEERFDATCAAKSAYDSSNFARRTLLYDGRPNRLSQR
jgi:hypothetical protein